jgi:ribose transport system substrate-binding protein
MRSSHAITIALVLIAAAGFQAGCGDDDEAAGGGAPGKSSDHELVFIPGAAGDDFFHTIWLGAKDEADRLGVSIEQQAPPKYEPASQIPIVNAAVARRPGALIVAATDAEALQAPLEQAAERGVKVVTFDTTTEDPSFAVTHVSSDVVEAGRMVAEQLVELTGGKGKLMYIDHAPGVGFARDLRSGFTEVVDGEAGLDLLPVQYFDLDPQKANSITRTTVTRHPDLAGAFVGVGFGSQGAIPALEAAGKVGEVKTVAFDAFVQNIRLLEAGKLDAVVSVAAREYGAATVRAAVDALNGKSVPDEVQPKICPLTAGTVDDPENAPCLYSRAPQ